MVAGTIRLDLVNVGRTPVWIESVLDEALGAIHDTDANGLNCLAAGESYVVDVDPAAGANFEIVIFTIKFIDVLDHLRTVEAVVKLHHQIWRLAELRHH